MLYVFCLSLSVLYYSSHWLQASCWLVCAACAKSISTGIFGLQKEFLAVGRIMLFFFGAALEVGIGYKLCTAVLLETSVAFLCVVDPKSQCGSL